MQYRVWLAPAIEAGTDRLQYFAQRGEVAVVSGQAPGKLPYPLDLSQLGAVGRQEQQTQLSSTTIMRRPGVCWRRSRLRKVWNVAALKIGHIIRTNWPVSKLTAPKQATDFRVGAWRSIGSLISGGTHMRQREPCCWK